MRCFNKLRITFRFHSTAIGITIFLTDFVMVAHPLHISHGLQLLSLDLVEITEVQNDRIWIPLSSQSQDKMILAKTPLQFSIEFINSLKFSLIYIPILYFVQQAFYYLYDYATQY